MKLQQIILQLPKRSKKIDVVQNVLGENLVKMQQNAQDGFGLVPFRLPPFKNQNVDQVARHLLDSCVGYENLIPCESSGDGNCLFNSISSFLYGNESFHTELRVRAMTELIINIDFYANPQNYSNKSLFQSVMFSTLSSKNINNVHEIIFKEALDGFNNGSYSAMICMYGLANALNIQIQQIKPVGPGESFLVDASNMLIKPFFSDSLSKH
jgi:hypothetical protein